MTYWKRSRHDPFGLRPLEDVTSWKFFRTLYQRARLIGAPCAGEEWLRSKSRCFSIPATVTAFILTAGLFLAIPFVRADSLEFALPQPLAISPNGTPVLSIDSQPAPPISTLDSLTLTMYHEWLGDLTVTLIAPSGATFTLFSQVGVSTIDTHGSAAVLGAFLSSSDPTNPNFDLVPQPYKCAKEGTDFVTEALTVVNSQDPAVIPTNFVYAAQQWVSGPFPPGTWQLVISDNSDLSGGEVSEAHLTFSAAGTNMVLNWPNPSDITYGTPLSLAQLNASVTVNGVAVPGTFNYTPPLGTILSTGDAQILSVAFMPTDAVTYSTATGSVHLNVKPTPLNVTVDNQTMIYGDPSPALTAAYSGFVNGDTQANLTQLVTLTTTASSTSSVGTYAIVGTGGASPNYRFNIKNGIVTVTKAPLLVVADNLVKVYGDNVAPLTASYSGFVNGDTAASLTQPVKLSTTATSRSPVGLYPIAVTGGASLNYAITARSGNLAITPALLTVTADAKTRTYGAANPILTAAYNGFVNGDTVASLSQSVTLSTLANVRSPVGTYPILAAGGASPNYTLNLIGNTLSVSSAILAVTADNQSSVYGAALPGLTATYSGFVNGESATSLTQPVLLTTTASATSPVGSYPIIPTGGGSPNYALRLNNGTLNIGRALLTITADNQTKPYGTTNPVLTATYNGFVNSETAAVLTRAPVLTTTASVASPAGSYPITASSALASNYNVVFRSGTLAVSKALLAVTADDKTKTYGGVNPVLTVTYVGFVNGDTSSSLAQPIILSTTATVKSATGSYPIIAAGGASLNYTIVPKGGTLVVRPAQLTVTADQKTKVYGAPLPALTATYTGFVNGDTLAVLSQPVGLVTTAGFTSPAGTYPITLLGGSSLNYEFKFQNGTLTVERAPLTIKADNKSKGQGAPLPAFTATYLGFVNGDSLNVLSHPATFATTATAESPVGNYPIIVSGADAPNYSILFMNGTLSVTEQPLALRFGPSALQHGPDGFTTIVLTAAPGTNIRLDSSADLTVWTQAATQTSANGQVLFKLLLTPAVTRQYYRAVTLP